MGEHPRAARRRPPGAGAARGLRGRGRHRPRSRAGDGGAGALLRGHRVHRGPAERLRGQGHRALRHRGAARGAPARDRPRRAAHRVGHDRAGRGLGPAPPRLPRAPRRRPLRDRREQDLLLPGRGLASQRGDLPLRRRRGVPGPGRAARRGRRARLLARARHPGDGAARHRHGRPGLRELPRARSQSADRPRRVPEDPPDHGRRAHRGQPADVARHRPGRSRGGPALRGAAGGLRAAGGGFPGHPLDARRHGGEGGGRAPARLSRGVARGPGRAGSVRGVGGQGLSPTRPRSRCATTRCRSTAATGTPASSRSSACCATRAACASATAPPRSRRTSSPSTWSPLSPLGEGG